MVSVISLFAVTWRCCAKIVPLHIFRENNKRVHIAPKCYVVLLDSKSISAYDSLECAFKIMKYLHITDFKLFFFIRVA